MTDVFGAPKLERIAVEPLAEAEAAGAVKRLTILPPPAHTPRDRDPRPITNLGRVFGQFAELQQQIAEQVVALEDSVQNQKQDIAATVAQLPELRERINWLIATFYEQSKKDESVRDRLNRHDSAIEVLAESVRAMHDQQSRWAAALDEVIASLVRAKTALTSE
jgi:septal ring factor EnvC (AmiA/AmiB activator)